MTHRNTGSAERLCQSCSRHRNQKRRLTGAILVAHVEHKVGGAPGASMGSSGASRHHDISIVATILALSSEIKTKETTLDRLSQTVKGFSLDLYFSLSATVEVVFMRRQLKIWGAGGPELLTPLQWGKSTSLRVAPSPLKVNNLIL